MLQVYTYDSFGMALISFFTVGQLGMFALKKTDIYLTYVYSPRIDMVSLLS